MPILNFEKRKLLKEEKKQIQELKVNGKYEEILKRYGIKSFRKNVSKDYKKQDIANIQKQGNIEAVYGKYGQKAYNQLAYQMKKQEIEETCGRSIKGMYYKTENTLKYKIILPILSAVSLFSVIAPMSVANFITNSYVDGYNFQEQKEEQENAMEIQKYEESIQTYAENIKKLQLNDRETILKVQDDMWKSILGYGNPDKEFVGYLGISLNQEEPVGCCRNFADDIVKRLNAINPEYHARCISVDNLADSYNLTGYVDIQTRTFESEQEVSNIDIYYRAYTNIDKNLMNNLYYKIVGNHVIVLAEIKEDNITLAIDPGGPILGFFKNGKIELFNLTDEKQKNVMERRYMGDAGIRGENLYGMMLESLHSYIQKPNLSQAELEEKYSIENLNIALESARKKERDYLYTSYQGDFKSSLKVNSLEEKKENCFTIYTYEEMKQVHKELLEKLEEDIETKEQAIQLANQYRRLLYSKLYYQERESEFLGKKILYDSFEIEPTIETQLKWKLLNTDAIVEKFEGKENMEISEFLDMEAEFSKSCLNTFPQVPIEELKVGRIKGENVFLIAAQGEVKASLLWQEGQGVYKTKEEMKNNGYEAQWYNMIGVTQVDSYVPSIMMIQEKER